MTDSLRHNLYGISCVNFFFMRVASSILWGTVDDNWKVTLNELADQACKEAAAQVQWREHQARVAQLDELAEEVSRFLASRAWILLAGDEAPPLDLKPRKLRRGTLPPKPKTKQPTEAKMPQQHNRPAPQGGLNKQQRLELLLASLSMCTGTGTPGPTPTLRTTPSSARYARCSFNKSTQRRCLLGWRRSIVRTGRCKTSVGSGSTPRTLFTIWVRFFCAPNVLQCTSPANLP